MDKNMQELRDTLLLKVEEYKQAVERHEFLEQHQLQEEIEQLKMQWHQLLSKEIS